ncbi:MAG: hypothetical protein NUV56_03135 [Candidatus Uhrbacteria bacterium]|nr:hypothetical protein [Candidatus Uhrbacteria bacterium]
MFVMMWMMSAFAQDDVVEAVLPEVGETDVVSGLPQPMIEVASVNQLISEHRNALRSCFSHSLATYEGASLPTVRVIVLINEDGSVRSTLLPDGSQHGEWPFFLAPRSLTCADKVFANYRVPGNPDGAWVETLYVSFSKTLMSSK